MIIVSNRLVILRVLKMNKNGFTVRSICDRAKIHGFEVTSSSAYSAIRSFTDNGYAIQIGVGLNETGYSANMYCLTNLGRKYVVSALKKIDSFNSWIDETTPRKAIAYLETKNLKHEQFLETKTIEESN